MHITSFLRNTLSLFSFLLYNNHTMAIFGFSNITAVGTITSLSRTQVIKDDYKLYFSLNIKAYKEKACLMNCIAYNDLTRYLLDYTTVGDTILVQGSLRSELFKDTCSGITYPVMYINVQHITMLERSDTSQKLLDLKKGRDILQGH
jgi:single-stranded DNA-binding protein